MRSSFFLWADSYTEDVSVLVDSSIIKSLHESSFKSVELTNTASEYDCIQSNDSDNFLSSEIGKNKYEKTASLVYHLQHRLE